MFSGSSTGRGAVLQLLCCPSKQGGLSENMLQNLIHNLTAQTVHRMPLSPHPLLRGSSRCNNAPSSTSNNSSRMFPILHPPKDRRLRLSPLSPRYQKEFPLFRTHAASASSSQSLSPSPPILREGKPKNISQISHD